MLYKYFSSIRASILEVSDVDVVWFNDQYNAGTIVKNKVSFIEFPERIIVDSVSKDAQRVTLPIRVHVVSRVMTKPDLDIPDAEIISHESLTDELLSLLRGMQLLDQEGDAISSPIIWRGIQHWHRLQGWMVTWLEFDCKVIV